jgi:pimeloyl-ACP methyl ester carboxylesterase
MESARPMDGYYESGGLRLHYIEWAGYAPQPVVLIHGSGGHAHQWDGLARALAPDFRVLAVDLRGHGESEWAEPPAYRAADYAGDLERFLRRMGLRAYTLIGHALGALLAAGLAAGDSGRVAGLVWVDLEARLHEVQRRTQHEAATRPAWRAASLAEAVAQERRHIPFAPAALLNEVTAWGRCTDSDGALIERFDRRTYAAFEAYDLTALLGQITCPTLLIRGAESPVMRRAVALQMAAALPAAKYVEIGRAQHFVFLDQPEEFARVGRRFLAERVWPRVAVR